MKKVVRIARLELSTLFYSPIGWLVLMVFIIQAGSKYTESLHVYQQVLFMGRQLKQLTSAVFDGGGSGLFPTIAGYLFLYIPLLTMGLISREIHSGSIKLLQSSPVKDWEVILGKFGAMMVYALALMMVLLIVLFTADHALVGMDLGMVLSGMLGLYLLICTYSAIGLFLSCLTSYQVIAAIATLVTLAVLNYIGQVGQDIDFVRDLTYFLSLSGRMDPFFGGLITTRDVLYFFTVMGLFLGLSMLKLWASRQTASVGGKAVRYGGLIVLVLTVIYLSSRPSLTGYVDMTADKKQTLTAASQRIVGQLDHPLNITTYVNLLDMMNLYEGLPDRRNIDKARFEMYRRFLPELNMRWVYYYDKAPYDMIYKENPGLNDQQLAVRTAESRDLDVEDFLPPAAIRKQIDLGPEEHRFVREVEYNGKKTFLRVFDDNNKFPGEQEISTALQRLITRPATVGFLTGNEERSVVRKTDDAYYIGTTMRGYRGALINQGFDVVSVAGDMPVPDSVVTLVVADPRVMLDSTTMGHLRRYIAAGGNLLVAAEPGRGHVMEPLLKELGIKLMDGQIVVRSKDNAADLLVGRLCRDAVRLDKMISSEMAEEGRVSLAGVAGLEVTNNTGFTVQPLIVIDTAISWNKMGPLDSLADVQAYRPEEGDTKGSFPLMVAMTRQTGSRQQRIIVSGDADFMSNKALQKMGFINNELTISFFHWLSNGAYPIDSTRPPAEDNTMRVSKEWIGWLERFFLYMLPALVAIAGGVLLLRRKMK